MRIATYNIAHGADYTRLGEVQENLLPVNLAQLAQVICSLEADVIALNEVYEYGCEESMCHQTEKLADMLGYAHYRFVRGADLGFCMIGNAILSRYPIESTETVYVPAPSVQERDPSETDWFEDRAILLCRLSVMGKSLSVASTHFGLNPSEQKRMLSALAPIVKTERPLVLLGDFNARPESAVLDPLRCELTDVAAALDCERYTFSSFAPDRRIDYIFVSKEIVPISCDVPSVICSDHLPIFSDISF
jgi:endonuclease/exonuclease/phosphatase family metal-dependent hydrolase